MLNQIVSSSLKLRGIVVILAILLMIVGVRTLPSTQLDVFPEFAPPLVEIQTEAPGLSTTEVESLVSTPIENTLNGLTHLKTLRSKSVLGLSSVVLIFEPGTQLMQARQLVQERLSLAASRLPSVAPTPNVVQHESNSRRIDVTCDVKGRDLGSVAREIESKVRVLNFERGYHPEFLGEYAARQQARTRLLALAGLALLGILMLLYADFQSLRLTLLVFLTFPFALVGGVLGAFASGGVLSLGSLIGFVTVLGIAARNGIMLVSHYRQLEYEEGEPFSFDLILRGAEERLAPILMTATVTALALAPIALGGVKPGQEIEYPMAAVILGGLISSTLLNLFLLPALYWKFGKQPA